MHREIVDWIRQLWYDHPARFHGTRVLECGAWTVPDACKISGLFVDCDYTGLDYQEGPGVDVVSLVHEYRPEEPFDVVVSCQMLEHDPYWRQSVAHMAELTKPGGVMFLTFPEDGWRKHDTQRGPQPGYYHNPDKNEVVAILAPAFERVDCQSERQTVFLIALNRKERI